MQDESEECHFDERAVILPAHFSVSSVPLCFTPSLVLHLFAPDLFAKESSAKKWVAKK